MGKKIPLKEKKGEQVKNFQSVASMKKTFLKTLEN